MPELHDWQARFIDRLFDGDAPLPGGIEAGGDFTPEQRMQVYRNTARLILTDTLRGIYPTVSALTGDDFFDHAADAFIKAHPPRGGNLDVYGAEFADFLAGFEPLRAHPYIGDVARLDRAFHDSYLGAREAPLAPESLAGLDDDAAATLVLKLQPHVILLKCDWPAQEIRAAVADDPEKLSSIRPGDAPARILVMRDGDGVSALTVGPAFYGLLESLSLGETLLTAVNIALAFDESFDFSGALAEILRLELLCEIDS